MSKAIQLTGLAIIVAELASLMTWQLLRPKPEPNTWLAFFTVAGAGAIICLAGGAFSYLIFSPFGTGSEMFAIATGAAIGVAVVLGSVGRSKHA